MSKLPVIQSLSLVDTLQSGKLKLFCSGVRELLEIRGRLRGDINDSFARYDEVPHIDKWEDLRVSLLTAKVPASSAPTFAQIQNDGSSSVGVYGYHFSDGEYIFFTAQLPHAWKTGTVIYPHIHFMTTTDVDPDDSFTIGMEYVWVPVDGSLIYTTTTTIEVEIPTGVDSSYIHQVKNLTDDGLDGTNKDISSLLFCRLYRAASTDANYADDVIITDVDFHYQVDSLGSTTPFYK